MSILFTVNAVQRVYVCTCVLLLQLPPGASGSPDVDEERKVTNRVEKNKYSHLIIICEVHVRIRCPIGVGGVWGCAEVA